MPNLLYVTPNVLQKLKQHKAYHFWTPFIQLFPIRNIPPEERVFYPREIEILKGYIYLTVDLKFVYFRDNMASFLYDDQDLSFRFSASHGILRTLDNKQFSAIIGRIAKVTASTDVELVDNDLVHHPLIDAGLLSPGLTPENLLNQAASGRSKDIDDVSVVEEIRPKRKRGRPRKNPIHDNDIEATLAKITKRKAQIEKELDEEYGMEDDFDDEIVSKPSNETGKKPVVEKSKNKIEKVNKQPHSQSISPKLRLEIIAFRKKTKKSYNDVAKKFGLSVAAIKELSSKPSPSTKIKPVSMKKPSKVPKNQIAPSTKPKK